MKIVHVISGFDKINYGVWNAALFGTTYLKNKHCIESAVVVCQEKQPTHPAINTTVIWAGHKPDLSEVTYLLKKYGLLPQATIIVSHGCWLQPTRLAHSLKCQMNYTWLYVPHGMLEPWSRANNRWKKLIYFHLFENRMIKRADAIRAVGEVERKNLVDLLEREVAVVENGVVVPEWKEVKGRSIFFLFMARLHYKKGIVPLVEAWNKVMKDSKATLIIAGPDEGELEKIRPYVTGNVQYAGAVYGEEKESILRKCHYYVLPSHSEGFPTSVVEAMSYGLIPVISMGCNFREVFENDLGLAIEPEQGSIAEKLLVLNKKEFDVRLSQRNHNFIKMYYSENAIGDKLFALYNQVMNKASSGTRT